ncbi:MAG: hypothetical protein IJT94_16740, partial [Oscillibacter sp.]|nr:hypothetical protein [Oscillibacter sp.]
SKVPDSTLEPGLFLSIRPSLSRPPILLYVLPRISAVRPTWADNQNDEIPDVRLFSEPSDFQDPALSLDNRLL